MRPRTRTEYRSADTSTIAGVRLAERLQRNGWICYSVGLFMLKYYKRRPRKPAL
jgi:hypothetical protein